MRERNSEFVERRTGWQAVVERLSSNDLEFSQDEARRRRADRVTYVAYLDDGEVVETVEIMVMTNAMENGVVTVTDDDFGDYMVTFDISSQGVRMSVNSTVHQPPMSVVPDAGASVVEQMAMSAAEAGGHPFVFTAHTAPGLR